jgi:hypothetical protein
MAIPEKKLLSRRQQLVARCEVERVDLIRRSQELQTLMSAIDSTLHAVRQVKQHPGIVLGALAAVLLIVKPRRVGALLGSVMPALRTWNVVAPVLQGLRQRH